MDAARPTPPQRLLPLLNIIELQQRHVLLLAILIRRRKYQRQRRRWWVKPWTISDTHDRAGGRVPGRLHQLYEDAT